MKTEEKRYFLDIRSGCAAVRDTKHVDYDKDYPGLHHDTCDVVEYRHGFQSEDNGWEMKQSDIDELRAICDRLNSTTQPQPTMSAEEIIDKYFKYNEFDKKRVVEAMEEYRNQPIEFNPPHSAQHEAEVLFNKIGYHKSIQILEYTMLNLKAANVSAVWHEEVLTILKGM